MEEKKESMNLKQSLIEFVKFFLIAVLIVVPIRLWIAQPFIVSGSSMTPNFENGEYLIVDEFSYHFREPARGEVIIFRYPKDPSKFFIKRIMGLPNEKIEFKNGQIYIYNELFPEGMLVEESYLENKSVIPNMSFELDENGYYVLGDNRNMSSDSRLWGAVHSDLIIGRAWIRLWPFSKAFVAF